MPEEVRIHIEIKLVEGLREQSLINLRVSEPCMLESGFGVRAQVRRPMADLKYLKETRGLRF